MGARPLFRLGMLLLQQDMRSRGEGNYQAAYRAVMRNYRELEGTALAQFELTMREHEVATHLMHGATYRQAASALRIAESTVRYHAQNVFRKAHVKDRRAFERCVHAWLNQWLDDEPPEE